MLNDEIKGKASLELNFRAKFEELSGIGIE
jgi:hypothetical protein